MNREDYRILPNPLEEGKMNPGKNEYVFLCGNPRDLPAMTTLGQKIQETYHAEVWISEGKEDTYDREELKAVLSEMQVLVLAVTRRFLEEPGVTGELLLPLVAEAGIEFLPVALEEGLGSEFTKQYGSLHLMNGTAPDFGEKLAHFIERFVDLYHDVTSWDTDPDHVIRQRMFISYRKKDIVSLKDLLRLLRLWKELTDVGIWYDDALVAGEDYNDQIKEQLLSADIFLLLVTPRLLENGNYVMRQEYPDAVAAGKTILPVMMEETDRDALAAAFPGIGEVYSLGEIGKLRKALDGALGREPGSIPELTGAAWFLLGKAYASGEGTERNVSLAKKAFDQAARLQYVWAIYRMARDLSEGGREEAAIPWMEQAFDMLLQMTREERDPEEKVFSIAPSAFKLGENLFRFYMGKENWRRAHALLAAEMSILQFAAKGALLSSLVNPAVLNLRFGQVFLMSGDTESAEQALSKALPMLRHNTELLHDPRSHMMFFEESAYYGRTLLSMIAQGQINAPEVLAKVREHLEHAMAEAEVLERVVGREAMSDMIFMVGLDYLRLKTDYRFFVQDPSLDAEMDQIVQRFLQHFGVFDEVMDAWDQTPLDFPADLRYEGSLYKLQYILLHRTLWYEVMVPQEQLPDIFSFEGPAPAGVFGETEGSLRASGCRCPSCGKNMYVAKFPHGHREPLHTGYFMNRDLIISESYLCPCGRLFAAPEGRSLTEGPVFAATPVIATDNPLGRKLFDMWWEYFEMVMQTY